MDTMTIRVRRRTHAALRKLAAESGMTMAQLVDEAVRELRRKQFWTELDGSYARLKADRRAWADFQREGSLWDAALTDGLDAESREPRRRGRKSGAR